MISGGGPAGIRARTSVAPCPACPGVTEDAGFAGDTCAEGGVETATAGAAARSPARPRERVVITPAKIDRADALWGALIGAKVNRRMKRFKAAVIGASGYGGAEIIRRLLIHPLVELVRVSSVDYVGEPLGAAHPNLTGRTTLRFENLPPAEAAAGCDVALLGLPHKVSA